MHGTCPTPGSFPSPPGAHLSAVSAVPAVPLPVAAAAAVAVGAGARRRRALLSPPPGPGGEGRSGPGNCPAAADWPPPRLPRAPIGCAERTGPCTIVCVTGGKVPRNLAGGSESRRGGRGLAGARGPWVPAVESRVRGIPGILATQGYGGYGHRGSGAHGVLGAWGAESAGSQGHGVLSQWGPGGWWLGRREDCAQRLWDARPPGRGGLQTRSAPGTRGPGRAVSHPPAWPGTFLGSPPPRGGSDSGRGPLHVCAHVLAAQLVALASLPDSDICSSSS